MLPTEAMRRWIFFTWQWLLRELGGIDSFRANAVLVTPTETDFPVLPLESEQELAEDYLGFVCEHARRDEVPRLVTARSLDDDVRAVVYRDEWLEDPELLITELALAISADALEELDEPPPPPDYLTAEVATVFGGFGLFVANTVARRREAAIGPIETRLLTLGEREAAYALAIFAWLSELPDAVVLSMLRPNPAAFYRAAVRELRHRGTEMDRLRTIRVPHRGPYR